MTSKAMRVLFSDPATSRLSRRKKRRMIAAGRRNRQLRLDGLSFSALRFYGVIREVRTDTEAMLCAGRGDFTRYDPGNPCHAETLAALRVEENSLRFGDVIKRVRA